MGDVAILAVCFLICVGVLIAVAYQSWLAAAALLAVFAVQQTFED